MSASANPPAPVTVTVPVTPLTTLSNFLRFSAQQAEVIVFERGSTVRRLETATFSSLTLKAVCIPASVEYIGTSCFHTLEMAYIDLALETVTFELGSRLREIASLAFSGCAKLHQICLPASIEQITGLSFASSGLTHIEIEAGNPHFHVRSDFVMTMDDTGIVRYFGTASEVTIPDKVGRLVEGCFAHCHSIQTVQFGSHLYLIDSSAFAECHRLKTICIPRSVIMIGEDCFMGSCFLETVTFVRSHVMTFLRSMFQDCCSLKSLMIPASVEMIAEACFAGCSQLAETPWPADSRLRGMGQEMFVGCIGLKSLWLPSSLEFLGKRCFADCDALTSLTFASPSHLRNLADLPLALPGVIEIPDSVEFLGFRCGGTLPGGRVLKFGYESKLALVTLEADFESPPYRTLLQLSTETLKLFRSKLEFKRRISHIKSSLFDSDYSD